MVSVRLMCYNHGSYLREALDSILMQTTSFEFEIVVGDDLSNDETPEILKEYGKKFPGKINVLNRPVGGDYYINRQKLGRLYNFTDILSQCKGKYIALLDGDDYWTDPLKLQKQVDFLEANEEFVLTFHDAIFEDSKFLFDSQNLEKTEFSPKELISLEFPTATLTICFRNILREFPDEFYKVNNGDTFLTFLLGFHGKAKYLKNIKPAFYRLHPGSIWSSLSYNRQKVNRAITFQYIIKYLIRKKEFSYIQRFNELALFELNDIREEQKPATLQKRIISKFQRLIKMQN